MTPERAESEEVHGASTLPELLGGAARRWPDRPAITIDDAGTSFTFRQLDDETSRYASALRELGVKRGDRVAVMLPNCPEFPLLWIATSKIAATMVPMNVNYRSDDAEHILVHSGTSVLITTAANVETIETAAAKSGARVLCIDGTDGDPRCLATHLAIAPAASEEWCVEASDTVNIQYTSGTTGMPKGCRLSHRFWLTIARKNILSPPSINESDTMLTAQPFYYMDPQWNFATAIAAGAHLILLDGFHPSTFWSKVFEYGVTYFYCLGAMPTLMLKMKPSDCERAHRVRRVYCSAIPADLHRTLEERFGVPWYEAYGMTESGSISAMQPAEHDEFVGTSCIGRPSLFREVRIVDEGDLEVSAGSAGEIVVRGSGMMDGYHDNPEATAEISRGGWLHTGDIGSMDEFGRLFFLGRTKDMIRRGGENVAAAEVEHTLASSVSVLLAACIGVYDEIRGEEIVAYVVPALPVDEPRAYVDALREYCAARLARFKVPRYWVIVSELPMTPSARVAKAVLREWSHDGSTVTYDAHDGLWHHKGQIYTP